MRNYDVPAPNHSIMFLAYPRPLAAALISERNHRFIDRAGLRGRPIPTCLLHVTLFSLGVYCEGEIPQELITQAFKAAAMVVSPPIDIVMDRLQSFRRNSPTRPGVLTNSDGAEALQRFHDELAKALIESGLKRFVKRSFTPHMTLFYDRRTFAPRVIDPVRWTMTEFVLVDSLRGRTMHVPLARWQLRGEPNG